MSINRVLLLVVCVSALRQALWKPSGALLSGTPSDSPVARDHHLQIIINQGTGSEELDHAMCDLYALAGYFSNKLASPGLRTTLLRSTVGGQSPSSEALSANSKTHEKCLNQERVRLQAHMDEQEEAMKKLTPVPKALNSRLIALQAMQLIAQSILQLKYIGKEMDNLVFLAGHYHTDVQTILETTPPDQFLTIVDQLRKQAKEKHRRSPVLEQAKKHLQRNPGEISAFRRALEEAIEEDIMDEFGDRNEVALAHGLFT